MWFNRNAWIEWMSPVFNERFCCSFAQGDINWHCEGVVPSACVPICVCNHRYSIRFKVIHVWVGVCVRTKGGHHYLYNLMFPACMRVCDSLMRPNRPHRSRQLTMYVLYTKRSCEFIWMYTYTHTRTHNMEAVINALRLFYACIIH